MVFLSEIGHSRRQRPSRSGMWPYDFVSIWYGKRCPWLFSHALNALLGPESLKAKSFIWERNVHQFDSDVLSLRIQGMRINNLRHVQR